MAAIARAQAQGTDKRRVFTPNQEVLFAPAEPVPATPPPPAAPPIAQHNLWCDHHRDAVITVMAPSPRSWTPGRRSPGLLAGVHHPPPPLPSMESMPSSMTKGGLAPWGTRCTAPRLGYLLGDQLRLLPGPARCPPPSWRASMSPLLLLRISFADSLSPGFHLPPGRSKG